MSLITLSCGIERYDDGSKLFKFYYLDGTLKKEQLRCPNEGVGDGYWKYYDEDGDITAEGQRTKGELCGLIKFYWKNGNLKGKEIRINGVPSGDWISCFENGQKECQGKKDNGKAEGLWWYFNDHGDTIREAFYTKGILVSERSYYSK